MDAGTTDKAPYRDQQHEAIREQLGAYAFDDLPSGERAVVRSHLTGCASCRAELADLEAVLAALPLALEEMTPPPGLRDRIEAAVLADLAADRAASSAWAEAQRGHPPIGATPSIPWTDPVPAAPRAAGQPGGEPSWQQTWPTQMTLAASVPVAASVPLSRPEPRRFAPAWLAAAALLLVSLGLLGWNLRLREQVSRPQPTVIAAVPRETVVAIVAQPPAPDAMGEVRIEPAEGLLLLDVRSLPPLAPGQVYQAWLIAEGNDPVPAGVFDAPDDRLPIAADLADGWTTLAVTAEPGPLGSPAPTTEIVLTAPLA